MTWVLLTYFCLQILKLRSEGQRHTAAYALKYPQHAQSVPNGAGCSKAKRLQPFRDDESLLPRCHRKAEDALVFVSGHLPCL